MTSSRERVERLLALATDPGASPEEARTAAVQACRIIQRDSLLGDGMADLEAARQQGYAAGYETARATNRNAGRRGQDGVMPNRAAEPRRPVGFSGAEFPKDPPTPEKTAYRAGWDRI